MDGRMVALAHPLGREIRHPAEVLVRMLDLIPADAGFDDLLCALDELAREAARLPLEQTGPIWERGARLLADSFLTDKITTGWQKQLVDLWMDRTDPDTNLVQR